MSKRIHSENTAEPVVARSSSRLRAPLGRGNGINEDKGSSTETNANSNNTLKGGVAANTLKPTTAAAAATSSTTASTITPNLQHPYGRMRLGARCAVYFPDIKNDFFGVAVKGRTLTGWYLGTVIKINKRQSTCVVAYDDKSDPEEWSLKDVQLVRQGTKPEDADLLYRQGKPGEKEVIVANKNPEKVKIGGLVMAYFQNGQYRGNPDAWYRGRVAEVGQSEDGTPVCAVAYDDMDYEERIPLKNGVLFLLERGFEHPAWLKGLTVEIPSKKFKNECTEGIIQEPQAGKPVSILYTKANGETVVEKRPYNTVVQKLLEQAKAKSDKTFHIFRIGYDGVEVDDDSHPPSPTKKQRRAPTAAAATKLAVTRKPSTRKPKQAAAAAFDMDIDESSSGLDEKKPAARKTTTRTRKAAATKKKQPATALKYEDDGDVAAIAETMGQLELDPELPQPTRALQSMNLSLASNYGGALQSSSPEQGYQWLSFLLSMNGRIPTDALWQKLLDLNAMGPIFRGKTIYPDSFKMSLCSDYLQHLFAQQGMLDTCSKYIDEHYKFEHQKVSYADTFMRQMTAVYYNAENDETRYTAPAADRIVETLRAKAFFADTFSQLLQHNLKPHVVAASQDSKRRGKDTSYKTVPIVCDIVKARRGSKDALEQSVRTFTQLYLTSGHFLTNGGLHPYLDNGVTRETLNLADGAMQSLTQQLGTVISYMAWLYSRETNENLDAVADIISNVVRLCLEEDTFDKTPLLDSSMTAEKFSVKMKLRLIQSIHKDIVPQLRPKLAEHLYVAKIYNMFYDN